MNKLITYLKEGKGRGLKVLLIFSVLATLLSWGTKYSTLEQNAMNPSFATVNVFWLHLGFILASFLIIWLLYILTVGFSALFSLAFRLQLPKGAIWRSSTISIITLFLVSVLLAVIGYILAMFGEIALLFYPLIIMIFIPVLLVMLIAFALTEPKEGKKKK